MATMVTDAAAGGGYPIRLNVPYPSELNRWLPLVKWLLAIPHLIILYFLQIAQQVVWLISLVAILITGQFPAGLFKFQVGIFRWTYNVHAYIALMRDEYPPFSFDAGEYPVAYDVDPPQNLNRWLVLVKWLLIIPHLIVWMLLAIAWVVVVIIAFFAILFTTKYPQGLFEFSEGVLRWQARIYGYFFLFTDEYPPFSLK
jgi:hypothetical protein